MPLLRGIRTITAALILSTAAISADAGKELHNAVRRGDVENVRQLLASGANAEAKDNKGRTPLMQAAERGETEIVKLLLARGANPATRDKEGLTAYALALVSAGEDRRTDLLALLPKPAVIRMRVDAAWVAEDMASSCFQTRDELARTIAGIRPDALVLGAFAEYARVWGRDTVELVQAEAHGLKVPASAAPAPASGEQVSILLEVRPGVACVRQSDALTLAIDASLTSAQAGRPVYKKTFGGGFKGLHSQTVANPGQYAPFFEKWAKSHAKSIYWSIVRAALSVM